MREANAEEVWLVRQAVRGLVELEHFDDAGQRERAMRALADRLATSRLMTAFVGFMAATPALSMWLLVQPLETVLVSWLSLPGWTVVPASIILIGIPTWGVPLAYFRYHARRHLRELLILRDIPVCRGCGYSLRGQPADSERCPECGQPIRNDVRRIIAGPQHIDLPVPPPVVGTE